MDPSHKKSITVEEEANLKDALKRCSPKTVEAALNYRKTGDSAQVPGIIIGIIERFLEPDIRPRLQNASNDIRILEDLGVDSLTMVEVVMLVEETLDISINNDELRDLRTLGDIKTFIDCKLRGVPLPAKPQYVTVEEIDTLMPHGQPFIFLQEAAVAPTESRGFYQIAGDEFFLEGHFKHNPVFPASIMLEALGQLAVLHLLKVGHPDLTAPVDSSKILFSSCDGVRCHRICKPGDRLTLTVKPKRIKHPVAAFEGSITCGTEKVAFAEEISLRFDVQAEQADPSTATASGESDRESDI